MKGENWSRFNFDSISCWPEEMPIAHQRYHSSFGKIILSSTGQQEFLNLVFKLDLFTPQVLYTYLFVYCFEILWKMTGINKAKDLALDIKEMLLY